MECPTCHASGNIDCPNNGCNQGDIIRANCNGNG